MIRGILVRHEKMNHALISVPFLLAYVPLTVVEWRICYGISCGSVEFLAIALFARA